MKKKILILTIILLVVTTSLFATTATFEASESYGKIEYELYFNGLTDKTLDFIEAESPNLSINEKLNLYKKYHRYERSSNNIANIGPFFLNFLVGFGSGAWLQRDYIHAGIQLGLDIIGLSLIGLSFTTHTNYNDYLIASAVFLGVSRIYQMITPWLFKNKTHKPLKEVLFTENKAQVTITPIIGKKIGLMANISI